MNPFSACASSSLPHRIPFDRTVGSTSFDTLAANCLSASPFDAKSVATTDILTESVLANARILASTSLGIPSSGTSTAQVAHRLNDYFPVSSAISAVLLNLGPEIEPSFGEGELRSLEVSSVRSKKSKLKRQDFASRALKQAEKVTSSVLRGPCFLSVAAPSGSVEGPECSLGDTPPLAPVQTAISLGSSGHRSSLSEIAAIGVSASGSSIVGYTSEKGRVFVNQRSGPPCRAPEVLVDWFASLNALCSYEGPAGLDPRSTLALGGPAELPDMTAALEAQANFKRATKRAKTHWELVSACRSYFILNSTSGVLAAVQCIESNQHEPAVVEAGLQFLYNLLHATGFKPVRQRIPVGALDTSASAAVQGPAGDATAGCVCIPPAAVTFGKGDLFVKSVPGVVRNEEEREYQRLQLIEDVRSEIKHLRSKRPLPYPGTTPSIDSRPRVIATGFTITSKRDSKVVQKLEKRGLFRLLFSIITRYVTATAPSSTASASTPMTVENVREIFEACGPRGIPNNSLHSDTRLRLRCVYLSCLLLTVLSGGTKQSEEAWYVERMKQTRGYYIPGGSLEDEEGDEQHGEDEAAAKDEDGAGKDDGGGGDSDEDEKPSGKRGGDEKSANDDSDVDGDAEETAAAGGKAPSTDIGGASSGPLKAALGTLATKAATLGRLSGASAVLASLYQALIPLQLEQMILPSTHNDDTPRIMFGWNSMFEPSGSASSPLSLLGFLSSVSAALCVATVGDSNVLPLLKRGLLPLCVLTLQQQPLAESGANANTNITRRPTSKEFAVLKRWSAELVFRLLCPTTPDDSGSSSLVWANSTPLPYSTIGLTPADTTTYIKVPLLQKMDGVGILVGLIEEALIHSRSGPSLPIFYCCCDILGLLASSSRQPLLTCSSEPAQWRVALTVGKLALRDSALTPSGAPREAGHGASPLSPVVADSHQPQQHSSLPLLEADWCNMLGCISRLHSMVDLPVGTDNDLCWLPPPELVEKLRKQQQQAAEKAAAALLEAEEKRQPKNDDGTEKKRRPSDETNDEVGYQLTQATSDEDDLTLVEGLSELFPELGCGASLSSGGYPTVHPSTSILGVGSVHHVKPFTEPRPMPSSAAVINAFPNNGIEALLVQSTSQRVRVLKRHLARYIFTEDAKFAVVYDDLPRSIANVPKPPSPGKSQLSGASDTLTLVSLKKAFEQPPHGHPPTAPPSTSFTTGSGISGGAAVPPLGFASNFECGNLKRAIQVLPKEYDLILHTDVNTNGFTQWFYFRVDGAVPGVPYRFNIVNMEKTSSTFNDGQRPLLFSENQFQSSRVGWTRAGSDILYFKSSLQRKGRSVVKSPLVVPEEEPSSPAAALPNQPAFEERAAVGAKPFTATSAGGGVSRIPSTTSSRKKPGTVSSAKPASAASSNQSSTGSKATAKKAPAAPTPTGSYYTLSFTLVFPETGKPDRFYLANCFPYTYSDLVGYLRRTLTSHDEVSTSPTGPPVPTPPSLPPAGSEASPTSPKVPHRAAPHFSQQATLSQTHRAVPPRCLFVQSLCATLSGNSCPLMTITSWDSSHNRADSAPQPASEEEIRNRPVVVLTSRVHPGESNASYMMKGFLDFLLDPHNKRAEQLRSSFVFKIVPMLNPDGVINGNHRCSLSGKDLNREYHRPGRYTYPTIFYLKALVRYMKEVQGRNVLCYSDFHGHSRCTNFVIYGGGVGLSPSVLLGGLLKSSLVSALFPTGKAAKEGGSAASASLLLGGDHNDASPNSPTSVSDQSARLSLIQHHPFLQESVPTGVVCEKLFPQILQEHAPFFASASCNYKIGKGKRNTGRGVFYRELGIRMSYTVEASMMGGMGCDFCPEVYDDKLSLLPDDSSIPASPEAISREAARWSITNRQLSATPQPAGTTPLTFCGHYSTAHFGALGAMYAKSLLVMWAAFRGNGGVLDPSPYSAKIATARSASHGGSPSPRMASSNSRPGFPFGAGKGGDSAAVGLGTIAPLVDIVGRMSTDARELRQHATKAAKKANQKKKRIQTTVTKKAVASKPATNGGKKSILGSSLAGKKLPGVAVSPSASVRVNLVQGSSTRVTTSTNPVAREVSISASEEAEATSALSSGRSPVSAPLKSFSGSYARSTRRGSEAPSRVRPAISLDEIVGEGPLDNDDGRGGDEASEGSASVHAVEEDVNGGQDDGESNNTGEDSGSSCSNVDEDDADDDDGVVTEEDVSSASRALVVQPFLVRIRRQKKIKLHQRVSQHAPAWQADVVSVLRAAFAQGPCIQRSTQAQGPPSTAAKGPSLVGGEATRTSTSSSSRSAKHTSTSPPTTLKSTVRPPLKKPQPKR